MERINFIGILDVSWYTSLYAHDEKEVLDYAVLSSIFEENVLGVIIEEPSLMVDYYLGMIETIRRWWFQCKLFYPDLTMLIKDKLENDEAAVFCLIHTSGLMKVEIISLDGRS